ncbi:MAG: ABC transporter substrate-binding protein [Fibromonadaceae bacterium]|jgi:iron complex transport system substrate-binding protein|nr:ABC transporter substrate-binding protein [Fibromonadaceae bacterium]
MQRLFLIPALLLLFFSACSKTDSGSEAVHFSIEYAENYKVLRMKEAVLVLLDSAAKKSALPDSLKKYEAISLPAKRVAVISKAAIAFMEKLELLDKIIAVENRDFIYSEKMQHLIDSLSIPEVGGGSSLDLEKLLMLNPDVVFTFGTGSIIHDDLHKLKTAGLPAVLMSEWKENHPLARLEWIKAVAILFGKEKEADSIFNKTAHRYDSLRVLAKNAKSKTVLTGYPNGSEWAAGGGRSYFAKLLEDAGATYVFNNFSQTGIMNLSLEYALMNGINADYWLHPSLWNSRAEILANEPRIEILTAWKKDAIYQNSLRQGKKGAADFYESGIVQPDEILSDLIGIFHPEILPKRNFLYYIKVL